MERIYFFLKNIAIDLILIFLKIIILIIFFLVFYYIGQKIRKIIRNYRNKNLKYKIKEEIITFTSDLAFYIITIIGLIIGLSLIGINTNAIWASLGLGGFALGFALKDIISNFLSGLMILMTKTLEINDEITINNIKGKIKSINLRYTILTPIKEDNNENEKEIILIPNSTIFSNISVVKKNNK